MISIVVHGSPMSQGSKSAVVRGGRAHVIEGGNTAGRERHKSWREAVRAEAQRVVDGMSGWAPMDGPLACTLVFRLPRPKSAPKRVWAPHTGLDLDKLARSVLDAISGVVIVDDARIVQLHAWKVFAVAEPCGVTLTIAEALQ